MLNDDHSLALRSMNGDHDAFGELVRRHQAAVFNVAYRLLGNRQDAEDAAQEAFIRAYRAFASYDPTRPLAPWLKRITANVCLNRLEAAPPEADALDDETCPGLGAAAADPEHLAQAGDLHDRVRREIACLPPRYRAVIELRHFQELRYEEIAAALGRPVSDVKSDLFRARKLLAQRLQALR